MSNLRRPRWTIYIGYTDAGQIRYYFEDRDPGFHRKLLKAEKVNYGRCLLFKGRNFVYKLKAHDAIEYCNGLNATEEAEFDKACEDALEGKVELENKTIKNHIMPLRTGGSGGFWFNLFR